MIFEAFEKLTKVGCMDKSFRVQAGLRSDILRKRITGQGSAVARVGAAFSRSRAKFEIAFTVRIEISHNLQYAGTSGIPDPVD